MRDRKPKDQLSPILRNIIYIAGIVFGVFITKSVLNKIREPVEKSIVHVVSDKAVSVRANKSEIKSALESYYMDYNEYPEKLEQLVPNRFSHTPVAICGKPYFYSVNPDGRGFILRADDC